MAGLLIRRIHRTLLNDRVLLSCSNRKNWARFCSNSSSSSIVLEPETSAANKLHGSFLDNVFGHLRRIDNSGEKMYQFFAPFEEKHSAAEYVEEVITDNAGEKDKEHLLELLRSLVQAEAENSSMEEKCLENFQNWVGHSKLGIGYLLFVKQSLVSEEYTCRLIKHMAKDLDNLSQEELVAMMLMIYVGKTRWKQDDIFQFLDPSVLQRRLATMMQGKLRQLSCAEINAVLLGLKKIQDFTVTLPDLRISMYEVLFYLGYSPEDKLSDVEESAVVNICLQLAKGRQIYNDNKDMISSTLSTFSSKMASMKLSTAVKVVSYGALLNIKVPKLTMALNERLQEEAKDLQLSELAGLTNFLVRTESENPTIRFDSLLEKTNHVEDSELSVRDVSNLVHSVANLLTVLKLNHDIVDKMFGVVNDLGQNESVFSNPNVQEISKLVTAKIFEVLFPVSFSQLTESDLNQQLRLLIGANDDRIIKSIVQMNSILALDFPEFPADKRLKDEIIAALVKLVRTPIPMEAFCPQMPRENLQGRHRSLLNLKHGLDNVLAGEGYSGFVHLLPHFWEADLVFGTMAGVRIPFPDKFHEQNCHIKPAPEFGTWFVVTPANISSGTNEQLKRRHLTKLGYKVVDIEMKDLSNAPKNVWSVHRIGGRRIPTKFEHQIEKLIAGFDTKDIHKDE